MTPSERAVVGIVLQEPRRLPELDQLTEAHFELGEHWQILDMLRELRTWDVDLLVSHAAQRPETGGPGYVVDLLMAYVGRETLRPHLEALEQRARERAEAMRGAEAGVAPTWGPVTHCAVLRLARGSLVVPPWRVSAVRVDAGEVEILLDGSWTAVEGSVVDVTRRLRWTGGLEADRALEFRKVKRQKPEPVPDRWPTADEVEPADVEPPSRWDEDAPF